MTNDSVSGQQNESSNFVDSPDDSINDHLCDVDTLNHFRKVVSNLKGPYCSLRTLSSVTRHVDKLQRELMLLHEDIMLLFEERKEVEQEVNSLKL